MGTPVIKERNLVHQTVEIPAATEGTTIPLLLKFTPGGKVDEIGERPPEESYTIPHPSYDQPDSYQEREIVIGNSTYPLPATLTVPKHQRGEKVPVSLFLCMVLASMIAMLPIWEQKSYETLRWAFHPTELQCCAMKNVP